MSFQAPFSGEEKRRLQEPITGPYISLIFLLVGDSPDSGACQEQQYLRTVQHLVENSFPIPPYLSVIFRKLDGWRERH
jgi:hypothetical protein